MKTLHLSIILAVALSITLIVIIMEFFTLPYGSTTILPSDELTVDGLEDTYNVGEQINFRVKFNELIGSCTQPHIVVKNQTDQTIWQSREIALPCSTDTTLHQGKGEFEFGNSDLGYLRINQTGTYYIHIWFAKEIIKKINVIQPTHNEKNSVTFASENNCGQFYTMPEDNHYYGSEIYPVLIMQQNSTGCAKITYAINYMYNDNRSGSVWSQMLNFTELYHISKYRYTTSGNSFGVSSIDATHMFKIKSIPQVIDLSKYPVGSQFTVTLVIQPLPNATGFYDDAIQEPPCDAYPLAVGYSLDQVNSSDFSQGMNTMHNHSCFNGPYKISSVQVAGMDFKLISFK